LINI